MTEEIMKRVDAYATAASMTLADPSTTRAEADRQTRTAVVAALEALTKDAERYQWLRVNGNKFFNAVNYQGVNDAMDKNTDAAIAASKEQT